MTLTQPRSGRTTIFGFDILVVQQDDRFQFELSKAGTFLVSDDDDSATFAQAVERAIRWAQEQIAQLIEVGVLTVEVRAFGGKG